MRLCTGKTGLLGMRLNLRRENQVLMLLACSIAVASAQFAVAESVNQQDHKDGFNWSGKSVLPDIKGGSPVYDIKGGTPAYKEQGAYKEFGGVGASYKELKLDSPAAYKELKLD